MEPVAFIAEHKHVFVIAHVLAIVTGMGTAIVTDLLVLRFGFDKKLSRFEVSTIQFLSRVVMYALGGIILTGTLLFLSNPEGYLASVKFLTKMTIVAALTVNGWLLHRYIFPHINEPGVITNPKAKGLRRLGFALGAVSIVSWISALSLGVLLHIPVSYNEAIGVYAALIVVAILSALTFESLTLEHARKRARR
ncbi:MAG: hypothetical protein KBD05_01060 [Candidatus Pacebacteria bacterium]|nr:hypothetical protein [Candidatus Paceibacterota bacterium]